IRWSFGTLKHLQCKVRKILKTRYPVSFENGDGLQRNIIAGLTKKRRYSPRVGSMLYL
ncbi:mCG144835, partial [Mus musculus]